MVSNGFREVVDLIHLLCICMTQLIFKGAMELLILDIGFANDDLSTCKMGMGREYRQNETQFSLKECTKLPRLMQSQKCVLRNSPVYPESVPAKTLLLYD